VFFEAALLDEVDEAFADACEPPGPEEDAVLVSPVFLDPADPAPELVGDFGVL
jgi:hypothetical protein